MSGAGASGPFLSALTADDARVLRGLGRVRRYDAGDALFHEGDEPGGVSILLSGRVKITTTTAAGKEAILAFRGPGDIVGELAALTRSPRSSAVRALEPAETLAVAAGEFERFLESHPRAAMNLVLVLIDRLKASDESRLEYASIDVVGRVARCLLELCERFGTPTGADGGIEVPLALSQEELAASTASSREAVARAMRLLRELGWIETRRRRILVLDIDALRRYTA